MSQQPSTGGSDAASRQMMDAIRANWDARAPHPRRERLLRSRPAGPRILVRDIEWTDLGELSGRDVLHLQCHLGTETAAFAQRGARTVGLDLSGAAVREARRIADRAGLEIEYVQANVLDAVEALGGRSFDVVYTGKGALVYVPDLGRWADMVARLLKPGGIAYVVEFHPLLAALGPVPTPDEGTDLRLRYDYLGGGGARRIDAARTYTDGPPLSEADG
jgi:2-polyprenyl-3-methyl-5-hydroxy-6-metoxy-1,4-benzoquinol methylase